MIYFIRHGQTDWNLKKLMQGQTDVPLNDTGRNQAKVIAKSLQNISFDKVFCSPLTRAKETCLQIVDENKITVDDRLIERNFGSYEGKSFELMITDKLWNVNEDDKTAGGESLTAVIKRVYEFLDEITKNYPKKEILIVSHGGIGMVVRSYFLGKPDNGDYLKYLFGNCEIITFKN